jgi:hypothetical protein
MKELANCIAVNYWPFLMQMHANKPENYVFTFCLFAVRFTRYKQTADRQYRCCRTVITSSAQSLQLDNNFY